MSGGPAPRRLRAVLFDAAGTLFELREPVGAIYARAAARHGAQIGAWRLDDAFARVMRQAPPMHFPAAAPAERDRLERDWWRERVRQTFLAADSRCASASTDALFAELFEIFAGAAAWRPRAGAREALEALRAGGLATGVVSNFDHRLPRLLASLGLAELLDCVVLARDCDAAKPARTPFEAALDRLGVAPAEAAFVGDDPDTDLAGARALGLLAIDVRELATLADLPARLERIRR